MTENIITSKDIPAAADPNDDPTKPEFERLGPGELLAIDIEHQGTPDIFYGGTILAELRIGNLRPDWPIEPRELQIIKVTDRDNIYFQELLSRAQKSETPISGIVLVSLPTSAQEGVSIEAAAFLADYQAGQKELILGRNRDLQWFYFGAGSRVGAVPESPYHDNNDISRQQVRIGFFGDRLLLEGLTEKSDIEVKTTLPHGQIN